VAEKIKKDGGSAVYGWITDPVPEVAGQNKNRFANIILDPHCLWKDDNGQLIEVTHGNAANHVIVDDRVQDRFDGGMHFCDSYPLSRGRASLSTMIIGMKVDVNDSPPVERRVIDIGSGQTLESQWKHPRTMPRVSSIKDGIRCTNELHVN